MFTQSFITGTDIGLFEGTVNDSVNFIGLNK